MRALRILLILAVVLGGVFVAVDRAALYFAESEAEGRIAFGDAEAGSTDVSIKGFPFLTQVAASEFDRVDVTVKDIRANAAGREIRISEIQAELSRVTLGAGYTSATASRASGTAVIPYAALTEAADDGVTVAYGGDGKVKVTGSVEIPCWAARSRAACSPRSPWSTATPSGCAPTRCRARASRASRAWSGRRPTSNAGSAGCPKAWNCRRSRWLRAGWRSR